MRQAAPARPAPLFRDKMKRGRLNIKAARHFLWQRLDDNDHPIFELGCAGNLTSEERFSDSFMFRSFLFILFSSSHKPSDTGNRLSLVVQRLSSWAEAN